MLRGVLLFIFVFHFAVIAGCQWFAATAEQVATTTGNSALGTPTLHPMVVAGVQLIASLLALTACNHLPQPPDR